MTWVDFAIARQLLNEEYFGSRIREAVRIEEAQAKATIEAMKGK